LLHNGVGFEAHPQNMLLRLSRSTLTPTGFIMRDLGGLRVHPATLSASTGSGSGSEEFAFLPGHCVVASTPEDAAKKLYHTLVHNHLQRLARVLRLHGDGGAWSVVRAHLTREIPRGSWLWAAWMDDNVRSVPGKCLVRMKLEGVYREVSRFVFALEISDHIGHICSFFPAETCLLNSSPVCLRTLSKLDTLSTGRGEWEVKGGNLLSVRKMWICGGKNIYLRAIGCVPLCPSHISTVPFQPRGDQK
jgi:hypothetical protein